MPQGATRISGGAETRSPMTREDVCVPRIHHPLRLCVQKRPVGPRSRVSTTAARAASPEAARARNEVAATLLSDKFPLERHGYLDGTAASTLSANSAAAAASPRPATSYELSIGALDCSERR